MMMMMMMVVVGELIVNFLPLISSILSSLFLFLFLSYPSFHSPLLYLPTFLLILSSLLPSLSLMSPFFPPHLSSLLTSPPHSPLLPTHLPLSFPHLPPSFPLFPSFPPSTHPLAPPERMHHLNGPGGNKLKKPAPRRQSRTKSKDPVTLKTSPNVTLDPLTPVVKVRVRVWLV